jgi:prepilin-type N-terminal cleavage/methylation domain-containing protein/prepilin-type processing-associated H-X9-DG protein
MVNNRQRRQGFTLIELLVVIAIIAILAAILFPVFAQAKDAAKKTQDLSNMKNITMAAILYAGDQDDTLPFVLWPEFYSNAVRFLPYIKNKDVFRSPKSAYRRGSYNTKQGGNPFGVFITRPDAGCMGALQASTRGEANWYDDVYFPLDYQWNDSIQGGFNLTCGNPWWNSGGTGNADYGMNMTDGKVTDVAKVAMWSTFPSIGTQWPGGCVDGQCENGTSGTPAASFWGANFKGAFAEGSNVSYLDGHAKYNKVRAMHPCGRETCDEQDPANGNNWSRTDFKAWGFNWAHTKVR